MTNPDAASFLSVSFLFFFSSYSSSSSSLLLLSVLFPSFVPKTEERAERLGNVSRPLLCGARGGEEAAGTRRRQEWHRRAKDAECHLGGRRLRGCEMMASREVSGLRGNYN